MGSCVTLFHQAYMEDHLKNKDRLQKEWEALCSYQAEPSSVSIAQNESNLEKNRYPDFVPCKTASFLLLPAFSFSVFSLCSTCSGNNARGLIFIIDDHSTPFIDVFLSAWYAGALRSYDVFVYFRRSFAGKAEA